MDITISNVFITKAIIEPDPASPNGYILHNVNLFNILQRVVQVISVNNPSKVIVLGDEVNNPFSYGNRLTKGYFIDTIISPDRKVIFRNDFSPRVFPGNTDDETKAMFKPAGSHPISCIMDLEPECTGIIDITFYNVRLSPSRNYIINVERLDFTNVIATLKSNVLLNDIGVSTGCPNYG